MMFCAARLLLMLMLWDALNFRPGADIAVALLICSSVRIDRAYVKLAH
jgi:hypothetical protein